MKLKRLTRLALLTAVALTIFLVELQIPSVVPIPGVKLGLSNIITPIVSSLSPTVSFVVGLAIASVLTNLTSNACFWTESKNY